MITVVGEALADLIAAADGRTFVAHPGGSPANVALGLSRLGTGSVLGTRLGDDLFGTMVATHLRESGVDVRALPAPTSDTSVAFAATDEAGVARYDFRITWDIEALPPLDATECLHTGSLATLLSPGAEIVEAAMRTDLTVSYDPNVRPSLSGTPAEERPRVERQVALSDVVKVSEEDLDWLYPGENPTERAARWLTLGPSLVVVTLGPNGAHATTKAHTTTRPGPPTAVVDTVGAGDAFTAGLLHWLSKAGLLSGNHTAIATLPEQSLSNALDFANAVAAITCSRAGANPPTLADTGEAQSLLP